MAKKEKKTKKEEKKFPAKKMPGMFKKSYTEKKLNAKVLKRLYIPADKKAVEELFEKGANPKKPELLAMPRDKVFIKADIKYYKQLSKQIKKQKSIFSFVPFVAVVAVIAFLVVFVSVFKNPVTKKVLVAGCQKVSGAKTEIRSVDLKIFGTSLTINGLAIGNKNEEFKNLFEAEKIEVSFSLAQALRGRFDCKNIEASGMNFNTDRKTSCRLPVKEKKKKSKEKEESENAFMKSVMQKKDAAVSSLTGQVQAMLGGSSAEEIVKNLEAKLKTPAAANQVKEQTEVLVAKWKSKPEEIKTQVDEFSSSVKALQKLDPSKIKTVEELKSTVETVNNAIEKSKAVKESVSSVTDEIKADSKTVSAMGDSIKEAVKEDKKFVEDTVGTTVNTVKNAKSIMNDAIEAVAMDSLGKYYPYAKKGLAYIETMKNTPKEPKKEKPKKEKKQERKRLRGITFWYGTTKPSFLVERVFASGPSFEAKITDVSNDMDLLGKPAKAEGSFSVGETVHKADLVVDARTNTKAKLVTANYTGSGFKTKIDGSSIASASGIPSVDGTASLTMAGTFDFDGFSATGVLDLNPVKLTSDGFKNETATKYYNKALASVTRLNAGYKAGYTKDDGVNLSLSGNFREQFGKALSSVISEFGNDAKQKALEELNKRLNGYSDETLAKVKQFAGIEGDINAQNANLANLQKVLDSKKAQLEKEIKSRAASAVEDAVKDKIPEGTRDKLKSLNKFKK